MHDDSWCISNSWGPCKRIEVHANPFKVRCHATALRGAKPIATHGACLVASHVSLAMRRAHRTKWGEQGLQGGWLDGMLWSDNFYAFWRVNTVSSFTYMYIAYIEIFWYIYIYIQSVFWFVIINSALCPKVSMLLIQFQCLRSFFWRPIPNHLLFSLGFAINVTRKIYNRSLNALFVSWMRSLGIVSSRPSPEGTLATFVLHLPKSWLEQPSNSILKTWFIQIF